ncbi:MAG: tRNA epoxyqueuosine(34) reductase QueG [Rikenellaceae bacterium]
MMYKYIKNLAINNGFELCGITPCVPIDNFKENIGAWIGKGFHAKMAWIERNNDIRQDPSLLFEGAKTLIVVAKYYNNKIYDPTPPRVARYAQNRDYHITMRCDMEKMATSMEEEFGVHSRCCVDSTPLAERYWAVKAGLGWIGKSGMLINREYGGFLTLGVILIDQECDSYDSPSAFNGCGKCSNCLDSCPTKALTENKTVDSRRCLSYLTVEHRGDFEGEALDLIKSSEWMYGCDCCTEVCPWSIAAEKKHERANPTPPPYTREELLKIKDISNSAFKRLFGETPLFHSGKKNIERNICIIVENKS